MFGWKVWIRGSMAIVVSIAIINMVADDADASTTFPVVPLVTHTDEFHLRSVDQSIAIAEISGRTYAVVAIVGTGVQIIDMTDPMNPSHIMGLIDDTDGFTHLDGANGVAITEISGRTYAVVTARYDDGVQIIDITDPTWPIPVVALTDNADGFAHLDRAHGIAITEISGRTYAVVAAVDDDGIQIIDMTDPMNPLPVAGLTDEVGGFTQLAGARDIAIAEISGGTYAVVTARHDDGVQIIDMTDPMNPLPAAELTDEVGGLTQLAGARDVAIAEISGGTYAAVAAWDGSVQIINMTDPENPAPVIGIPDNTGDFAHMDRAHAIAISSISDRTYAVVAAWDGNMYVIDMTDPANPSPITKLSDDTSGFTKLTGTYNVATAEISGRTYAAVTASGGMQIIAIGPAAHPDHPSGDEHDDTPQTTTTTTTASRSGYQPDPYLPVPMAGLNYTTDGFASLGRASDVDIAKLSNKTYAVVAVWHGGVQIIDITDPTNPLPLTSLTTRTEGFANLIAVQGITIAEISGKTYAMAAANGMHIIDITNPSRPIPAAWPSVHVWDTAVIEISGRAYAAAATRHGVQIINITDPAWPIPLAAMTDNADGFTHLDGAHAIAISSISNRTYAVVAAWYDDGVQIIDMTDPTNPLPVAGLTDEVGGFTQLAGARDVAIAEISGGTYAVVAAHDDNGVQIINMTDPENPAPVIGIPDNAGGFTHLGGAHAIAISSVSNRTYAVVAAMYDDGVQIIDMTDPTNPLPVAGLTDDMGGFTNLAQASSVAITEISGRTNAVVIANGGMQIIDIGPAAHPDHPSGDEHDDTPQTTTTTTAPRSGYQPDPYLPVPVAGLTDDMGGFTNLAEASRVAITEISGRIYAAVTAGDGVQIIDITNPANPRSVAGIADLAEPIPGFEAFLEHGGISSDDTNDFTHLAGAHGIAITEISNRIYAVVAATDDDGIQIIDMTDPGNPFPVIGLSDDSGGFTHLAGAHGIAITQISNRIYAVVASLDDDGIQIIDMTDPANPVPVTGVRDGDDGFYRLDGASSVTITEISGRTYAVVTSLWDDAVHIIDMTDPANPVPVADLASGHYWFTDMLHAYDVEVTEISGRTYAVVATWDSGVHIIDMTVPANSFPVASMGDGIDGFNELNGPRDVAITEISGRTYAVVASLDDDGVQIIDITRPPNPIPITELTDGVGGFTHLGGAHGVAITEISGRTYAVVAAQRDNGIQIIDITPPDIRPDYSPDPSSPVMVAVLADGVGGFNELFGVSDVAISDISGRTYAVTTGEGVQIIDMTDPTNPLPVAGLRDETGGFTRLDRTSDIAISEIAGRPYAVTISQADGTQFINMTDPTNPVPVAGLSINALGIAIAEISGKTYAVTTGIGIQFINMTDPTNPIVVAAVTDQTRGVIDLTGVHGIAIAEISGRTYAVVSALSGAQIIDMTDPTNPVPVVGLIDEPGGVTHLGGAGGIAIAEISAKPYAVIAAGFYGGVQIINMTNPTNPVPVAWVEDGVDGFTELDGAVDVAIVEISGSTYAVVAALRDDGVQIIDMTDPMSPLPVAGLSDGVDGFRHLDGARAIAIAEISGGTYVAVTSPEDHSVQIISIGGLSGSRPIDPPVATISNNE